MLFVSSLSMGDPYRKDRQVRKLGLSLESSQKSAQSCLVLFALGQIHFPRREFSVCCPGECKLGFHYAKRIQKEEASKFIENFHFIHLSLIGCLITFVLSSADYSYSSTLSVPVSESKLFTSASVWVGGRVGHLMIGLEQGIWD